MAEPSTFSMLAVGFVVVGGGMFFVNRRRAVKA
jgi:hypothetical protein